MHDPIHAGGRRQHGRGSGIGDGDLLTVNRSLTPRNGDVVVAVIGDGFACKRVFKTSAGWEPAYKGEGPTIDPDQGVEIGPSSP